MEVFEKVNSIIKAKGLTKRAFSNLIQGLEPKLRITGEIPSENTIYTYLSGRVTIPIELIPYIAEALDITEQELFDTSSKTRKRCFKYFLQNASKEELEYFRYFIETQMKNNLGLSYDTMIMNTHTTDEKITRFVELPFAPSGFIDKVLAKLSEYEQLEKSGF